MEYRDEITCPECGEKLRYPVNEWENFIFPEGCTFIAVVGEDTITIRDGDLRYGFPPLEYFENIRLECLCGNIIQIT